MPLIFLLTGILSWTFFEYVIHRFLGHQKKENNPVTAEHHRHHREGDYFAPAWKKLILAVIVVLILTTLIGKFFGWLNGAAFSFGLVGMFLVYETIHKTLHVWAPKISYGRWARKHHFYHHFKSPSKNHGVTTPLWDIVFGTYQPVNLKLRVPKKMAMTWLANAPEKYKDDYEIVGR